jgi:hypothetical protein
MNTTTQKLKEDVWFERATGTIGAWVHGIELGSAASAARATTLRRAFEGDDAWIRL